MGAVGALDATGTTAGVSLSAGAVTNGVEYRYLRDGSEIRGWTLAQSITDTGVVAGVEHSYTYQSRNPGGTTSVSAAAVAARLASSGRYPWSGRKPFVKSPFNDDPF